MGGFRAGAGARGPLCPGPHRRDTRRRSRACSPSCGSPPQRLPSIPWTEQTGEMARNVLCLVGIHHWVLLRNDEGEAYTECSRCGTYTVTQERGNCATPPAF